MVVLLAEEEFVVLLLLELEMEFTEEEFVEVEFPPALGLS